MPTAHADIARLAHRALRLRENGVDSERKLRQLDADGAEARPGRVEMGRGNALAEIASRTVDFLDEDRRGPTDPKLVEQLMGYDLTSIWQAWDEATTANLERTLDAKDLKQWRDSRARDQAAFDERQAEALDRGEFPVHPYFGHLRHTKGAANALYDVGREGILDGSIDVVVATVKVVLVDSADYSVNLATHQFLSSVASGGRVATTAALASKTTTAGVFDAADTLFTAVTGDVSEALVIYQSSAVGGGADVADTSQRLIGYIDTATGLPVTPNGGNITVTWDSGANRIFKL